MRSRSIARAVRWGLAATTLALSSLVMAPDAAGAQTNPFQRGPNPTESALLAAGGPYAISSTGVVFASGFGGGTIYYPTTTGDGTFGGVVVAPGFLASSANYAALAQRVASHGFVVFAINTTTIFDIPQSRGQQILAALNYLTGQSSVRNRVDPNRLAVAGHSMGGGGTLEAARQRPSLQAAVPLQPWHTTSNWSGIRVPTMIVGAQADTIAPVATMSEPFYQSIPASSEKAYAELAGASHFAGNSNPAYQGRSMVVWLKRYVDDDTRYEPFMCPAPRSTQLSEYRDTCPG
jgi:dienelactone hydrolase